MSDVKAKVMAARQKEPGQGLALPQQKIANVRHVLDSMTGEFAKALPRHIPAEMYLRAALTSVQKTPALLDCSMESFLGALMASAAMGLMPGTTDAALVPMGKTCTLIPQWHGMVKMMYNSGAVESVVAEFIHENDEWYHVPSRRPPADFHHAPAKGDRGEVTHAYAFAWLLNGGRSRVSLLTVEDGIYIRNRFSKVYAQAEANGKKNSFWHTDFNAGLRKSAVRRVLPWVPSSAEIREFLSRDTDDGEITSSYVQPAPARPALSAVTGEDAREVDVVTGEITPASLDLGQEADGAEARGERGEVRPAPGARRAVRDPARQEMFRNFTEAFPALPLAEMLEMVSGFAGHAITVSEDLTDEDVVDINVAFTAARTAAEGDTVLTAEKFREFASFAAANEAGREAETR